jgi:hypothetical protein
VSSFIGWLDYSEADQRQVRELLKLFSDQGTVDDLGLGTVRDAFSNQLFPGTSVIQTRARYFLFIPWIYRHAEQRHPSRVIAKGEDVERKLIEALRSSDDLDGLIGRQAGVNVRTLPSAIYWNGLGQYEIFQRPGMGRVQYGRLAARPVAAGDLQDELTERSASFWHRDIPAPPEDFFDMEYADFTLTLDEAIWLSERVLATEAAGGDHMLGGFVRSLRGGGSVPDGPFWEALPTDLTPVATRLAHHAQHFSVAMHSAALLYNLMLAEERCRDEDRERSDFWREQLAQWAIDADAISLIQWASSTDSLWDAVVAPGVRIPPRTRRFVDDWAALLTGVELSQLADNPTARELIRNREVEHKRGQARFANAQRLAAWNGDSGSAPLSYRWFQVQRFLNDLAEGLQQETEGDDAGD